MVALLRTVGFWRTRARDLRQPGRAMGDKFPKSCRRPLSLLAFVFAFGRELFWRVEPDQARASRLAYDVDRVPVGHREFLLL
jgi:hypothetical protein